MLKGEEERSLFGNFFSQKIGKNYINQNVILKIDKESFFLASTFVASRQPKKPSVDQLAELFIWLPIAVTLHFYCLILQKSF